MQDRHSSFPSIKSLSLREQVQEEFGFDEEEDDMDNTLSSRVNTSHGDAGTDEPQPRMTISRPDTPCSPPDFDEESSSSTGKLPSLVSKQLRVASIPPGQEADLSDASETSSELESPRKSLSKHDHALHGLLSSERAYASDLALVREVHIPLATGLSASLHDQPLTLPTAISSSSPSSNSPTMSTASSDSLTEAQPPMTPEDVKTIFRNIVELAAFADTFVDALESALGRVVEGGKGDDCVGELFLRVIPELETTYKPYIMRHPTALEHLQSLPQTPALTAYLEYTQRVSCVSSTCDLASLLVRPVQRLPEYQSSLIAILEETPDGHPDKDNLREARARIEEIVSDVNEGQRRAKVVMDVLKSKTPKKLNSPVAVAASVNLNKLKNLRHGGITAAFVRVSQLMADGVSVHSEAAQVKAMQNELKRIEVFAQLFAKNVVDWGKMMANLVLMLRTWAVSFGIVVGVSQGRELEAFDAFVELIRASLMPLTAQLEASIANHLLKDMAHLLMTMNQPLKLLASMHDQEPYHYHLLSMPVSQKNRARASLLAASTNHLALRGQLAAELPTYLVLMHQGIAILTRRLVNIQMRFWKDVSERWAELWEMLRGEGEPNDGWEYARSRWYAQWPAADEVVQSLSIIQPVLESQPTSHMQFQAGALNPAVYPRGHPAQPPVQKSIPDRISEIESYFVYRDFYMATIPSRTSLQAKEDQASLASR